MASSSTPSASPSRGRWIAGLLPFLLLGFAVAGVWALWPDLTGVALAALVVPLVVIAALRLLAAPRLAVGLGVVVGALVIPVLALLGVGLLWAWLVKGHLHPLASLIFGAVMLGLAAWIYLRPWWAREPHRHPVGWALLIAVGLVLLPPFVFFAIGEVKGDERALSLPGAAVSRLDVIVLRPGTELEGVDQTDKRGWDIHTWVGDVNGDTVGWGPDGPPPFVPADDADTVLLLMVDGGPDQLERAATLPDAPARDGEVARWLRLADEAAPPSTPTFALLRTSDDARLGEWRDALAGRGAGSTARRGKALALQSLAGTRTTTDLALRLAVLAPTSDQDLALAAKHRPALFFDSDEPYPTPLNIDRVLASGKLRLCDRGQAVRTLCPEVHSSADLHNGATHLAFDPDEIAGETRDSTIYVNVRRSGNDHRNAVYLDYWWYFPNNPTGAAGGALCGPGFVIAGVTCLDHQSDWEGVTVILDEDSPSPSPTAVSYAQHGEVIRYTWPALERLWDIRDRAKFGKGIDTRARPLVFVASGTHASYPTSCRSEHCRPGGVPDLPLPRGTTEQGHDGEKRWSGNEEARCRSICLNALPTRKGGRKLARWNAFEGNWGTTDCLLGAFCTSSDPPRAPGFQDRYERPWCADHVFSVAGGAFKRSRGQRCTRRTPSDNELKSGEHLLALGDSFSSGQGAGSYDPDTTGHGNTCYRSSAAWPEELAANLELVALPSLACSGARIRHVIENSTKGEAERQVSQLSRIDGDPDVITITIGGNDAGFADVLKACVEGDCVEQFDRPSGDVLERDATDVARQLPGVYRAIGRAAPEARLVVVGYPRLFPEQRPRRPVPSCAAWQRISVQEVQYLNRSTRFFNAAIAGAAATVGAGFVDVTEAFDGRELGCTSDSYLNPLRVRVNLFPASFHPNAAGHERLAEVVAAQLATP